MAIKKSLVSPAGDVSSYWTVQSLFINKIEIRAQIMLYGYTNEEARNNEPSKYIQRKIYNIYGDEFKMFSISDLDIEGNNPIKIAYDYIISKDEEFKDAANV